MKKIPRIVVVYFRPENDEVESDYGWKNHDTSTVDALIEELRDMIDNNPPNANPYTLDIFINGHLAYLDTSQTNIFNQTPEMAKVPDKHLHYAAWIMRRLTNG